ncbi:MAG TPA: VWA domain-containing protein [Mariprofundaceae bacterium]|nr:VWA domain-containing protein [Mariprofundaceae bacterium]
MMEGIGHLHLQHPWGLLPLLMLPWLLWVGLGRRAEPRSLMHPGAAWLQASFAANRAASPRLLMVLMGLAWLLWCIALAEPQWVNGEISVSRYGRDIMLLVDLSGSMVINDYSGPGGDISRLQAVKQVLTPFVEERATDRIGLVVFGEQAYVQTPLTYDHALVRKLLDKTEVGLVGDRTAVGDGIALAVKHLKHAADTRKAGGGQVIILLTDGRNNTGTMTPMHAAEIARALGIRIYTVGVGSSSGDSATGLDEPGLKQISDLTGGKYFRATDSTALTRVADEINRLERVQDKHTSYFESVELYPAFVTAGLLMLGIAFVRGRSLAAMP